MTGARGRQRDLLRADRVARADLRRAVGAADPGRGHGRRRVAETVLWVTVAAMLVVAGVAVTRAVGAARSYSDTEFRRAAVERVTVLLSPDPRSPDNAARILAGATGEFRSQFAQSADAYSRYLAARRTTATGRVLATGVADRSADAATVLVAARVTFDGPDDTVRDFRLRVGVRESDGALKLAVVQYLP